eukprot:gnl/TRDRNA2_/TRDRNA2_35108_c0_seq1.p1 gnl/TRDRNA2_/TRDRNA2_35108_c0~~gnl/TRDRNA2_/TRDRNA2_35108_c0_seq1.p1  ORF type:complete len:682 (+),score=43.30 gnl/TRDRNA2_/TRDRNA2_35108_c0_seq1:34-2079(+)
MLVVFVWLLLAIGASGDLQTTSGTKTIGPGDMGCDPQAEYDYLKCFNMWNGIWFTPTMCCPSEYGDGWCKDIAGPDGPQTMASDKCNYGNPFCWGHSFNPQRCCPGIENPGKGKSIVVNSRIMKARFRKESSRHMAELSYQKPNNEVDTVPTWQFSGNHTVDTEDHRFWMSDVNESFNQWLSYDFRGRVVELHRFDLAIRPLTHWGRMANVVELQVPDCGGNDSTVDFKAPDMVVAGPYKRTPGDLWTIDGPWRKMLAPVAFVYKSNSQVKEIKPTYQCVTPGDAITARCTNKVPLYNGRYMPQVAYRLMFKDIVPAIPGMPKQDQFALSTVEWFGKVTTAEDAQADGMAAQPPVLLQGKNRYLDETDATHGATHGALCYSWRPEVADESSFHIDPISDTAYPGNQTLDMGDSFSSYDPSDSYWLSAFGQNKDQWIVYDFAPKKVCPDDYIANSTDRWAKLVYEEAHCGKIIGGTFQANADYCNKGGDGNPIRPEYPLNISLRGVEIDIHVESQRFPFNYLIDRAPVTVVLEWPHKTLCGGWQELARWTCPWDPDQAGKTVCTSFGSDDWDDYDQSNLPPTHFPAVNSTFVAPTDFSRYFRLRFVDSYANQFSDASREVQQIMVQEVRFIQAIPLLSPQSTSCPNRETNSIWHYSYKTPNEKESWSTSASHLNWCRPYQER